MSWKEDVDESDLYTDASNRCLPEAFNLCLPRRVVNKPVEDRKSGTNVKVSNVQSKTKIERTSCSDRDTSASYNNDLLLGTQRSQKTLQLHFIVKAALIPRPIVGG
jgi:hypothetical protein